MANKEVSLEDKLATIQKSLVEIVLDEGNSINDVYRRKRVYATLLRQAKILQSQIATIEIASNLTRKINVKK